ncbi:MULTISPECIES: DnrO protein [unclassified Luteimonas]|uniref:DnrO protein n=1 Tax=unclassified Luteimonas TaxID=2629088 RepID=UPI0015FF45D9|nr:MULTISPECIES: DnrO protein [unclassified Luteimonas]MBB1472586.1 DnrO protein [Luteimonas sp. MC1782]MBB6598694.1 DnrO protein [Luteimonas sp. MC1825]QOC88863.1 DnrO protein [Luteimonas sp. MC1825]
MKTLFAATTLALALGLAAVPATAAAQEPHAGHAAHATHGSQATHAPVPAAHVRWTPDAPLVEGMARVREAMTGLAHHEMGHLGESNVLVLATDIDQAIEYMFANCKLDAEPDIALHGLLARLMAGTQALRADPANAAPVADMRAAVADYGLLFDDPEAGGEDDAHEDAGD